MFYRSKTLRKLEHVYEKEGGIKPYLLHLYGLGLTYHEIADKIGFSCAFVGKYMKEWVEEAERETANG